MTTSTPVPAHSKLKAITTDIICCAFILLFVYAGMSKMGDSDTFRTQLSESPITTAYARAIAFALPKVELLIALLLIIPRRATRLLGLYSSLFLMTLFTAYIYLILHYSFYVPCSCGGVLSQMSWSVHFVFNIVFILLAILGILLQAQLPAHAPAPRPGFTPGPLANAHS